MTHAWEPITDLDWDVKPDEQLAALRGVWLEQRQRLEPRQLNDFTERLQREWAIETGIIERVYSLSRGVTRVLIERGLEAALIPHGATDRDPEDVGRILNDQKGAIEGLFDFVAQSRDLSTSYIKQVHQELTRHQATTTGVDQFGRRQEIPLIHGDWKTQPNNPERNSETHEYCPPEHVHAEMDRLLAWHEMHSTSEVAPEIEAAWLHHRFTQIHPFQDGNGRVVRILASLVFLRAGSFPLSVDRDQREEYIRSLEQADGGDLQPLVGFFAALQRHSFMRALRLADDVVRTDRQLDQVIAALGEDLAKTDADRRASWDDAKATASELSDRSVAAFEGLQKRLETTLARLPEPPDIFVDAGQNEDPQRRAWHRYQIIHGLPDDSDHFANTSTYAGWVRLAIRDRWRSFAILVSFHGYGRQWRGVIATTAVFYERAEVMGEDGETRQESVDISPLSDEVFQINYIEHSTDVEQRFDQWLDRVLVTGLETWRTRSASS